LPRRWDGTRVLAIGENGSVTLQNRHGITYTVRLPEVVKALQRVQGKWGIDGEVVFLDESGMEEFTPCQRRCATHYPDPYLREQFPVKLEAFDVLEVDGINVEKQPYFKRKEFLQILLSFYNVDETIQYVPFEKDLPKAWNEAIRHDREGLIIKQVNSAYEHERSYNWLKVKNWRFECDNVVGFTAGENARSNFFGSLVLERNGEFRGCAGSGFNEWELRKFKDIFSDAQRMPLPYSYAQVGEPYTAVKVDIQVLVKFYQVTDAGVLRFPIFVTS
jgi:bifunctional non-homologous end joining protein LigD